MAGRLVTEARAFAASAPLVTVDGEATGGYRATGERGRLLVVLPGLVGPADAVASLAVALGPGWRVCAVTYPRVDSIEALIDWLERLRAREGGGRASVYGGSFGGLVAQAWLRAHPEAIGDLVLSGVGPPEPARAAKNARAMRWMRRLPMPLWRAFLRLAVRLSTARAADRDDWRRFYAQAIDALTWPDLESRYRISIGVDEGGAPSADALAGWSGRLLVLEGGRDRVARRSAREALRTTYAGARVHTFTNAGHAAALEIPEAWLDVVSGFFKASEAPETRV
jgi:3-oxoadipate enol-lactonase